MRSNDDIRSSAPLPMPGPSRGYDRERERDRRQTRRSRHSSPSSSDALSLSSSGSSSSYLDISRWYPSYGRAGGVLNAFFKTPSERRQRARRRRSLKKKNRGIFAFGGNNSSSSSVNSDMAYGMGFVRKPKSRNFSPRRERAATLDKLEGRPPLGQRRQTDEEILEIGRKLAKVARDSNREDMRAMGKRPSSQFSAAQDTWDKYARQTGATLAGAGLAGAAYAASSRGVAPSKHGRHSSSSSDDEWESASEGEYSSDGSNSGLAYGAAVDLGRPSPPPKSSVSRHSTVLSARPPEDIRPPDRKSSAVDPRLFGPVNSLRGLINTPCGYGDRNSVYTIPGPAEQRYAGSAGTAESASIEARPMQTVYPVQTSDPSRIDAARASGSLVSSQPGFSALSRDPSHSSRRPEPIPIQAPKPIAPVPTSMYDEQRIRDSEQTSPRESRIRPSENKTFAETALVGAGVAALGAAIMAGRDKGKGKEKEKDAESRHGRHEKYGHDDHREDETVVQDSRRAKELALEKEIARLERALSDRNKAREQRRRDSKRDSAPELSGSRVADADAERDYDKRRRDRDSRFSEPDYSYERPETSRRVSEPVERPAAAETGQTRRAELPAVPSSSGVDVFQFQVPDDAFRTRDSPLRAGSPVIIDVTPAPSPPLEDDHRKSRRESFEDELRDAKHIYEESMHSTAPISAVDMAAAIAATERARHRDEPERGRTLTKTQDLVQENANAYYHARRMAEREVSSRSRSKSDERSVTEKYDKEADNEAHGHEIVRIVTPPEMKQKTQKHKYSEPNADFRFDNLMSPKDLDHFRPYEYLVRDPSAERPRPLLNLVIPTPVPTPTPDSQKKKSESPRSTEPVVREPAREEAPEVVISPRGEIVEAPQTPSSKRVSWGPSETQQYEVESPERSLERRSRSHERERSPSRSSGWGATAAAVAGIAAAAALSKDDEPEPSSRDRGVRDSVGSKLSEGSRSPPSRKVLPKGTAPSRVLDDEPEDVPPAPGPKPASPRSSQMPGAFADDLDFAATLAAGLQDTGFDPNIVIEDAAYRRRDSPPGSNEHTGVYMQPFSETVTDLGVVDLGDGSRSGRESSYVIGELADTPASEKGSAFDTAEGSSRRQSRSEKTRSFGSDSIEVIQDPEEGPRKLSKKEQRKLEKAARSAKLAEEEERASQPAEAGDDDWAESSTSRKSKRSSKKSKRTSVGWDDADTPVNDRRVSVPVDAYDDLDDTKPGENVWEEPQKTSKSKRDSKGYDMVEDPSDRRERRREERRRSELYEPLDRDVTSVVSDSRHDDRSNGRQLDDDRSVVSAPDGKRDSKSDKRSSKEDKRSSGGFWGLLKGSNGVDGENQSKKDNAGTLGAGAGVAGAVAVSSLVAGSLASSSDAAEAPLEQEESQYTIVDVEHPSERRVDSPSRGIDVFDFQDPEITPRVIKPAIDPQYGDLLPLPPSPSDEQKLDFDVNEDLPSLPDSRPATPPGQERLLPREQRDSSQKRPGFPTHSRRRSAYDMPLKSPSHTAIPIAFRMGQRSSIPVSPRVVSNPTSATQSPSVQSNETFSPSTRRSPRPPSWDRPTSWESTREIKPLYLIERSAHADQDAGDHGRDDTAENTPLPPSRDSETPAPDFEDRGETETEARSLESAPLFVDTAAARAAPLGSQEPTPKGLTQTDSGLPDSAREFDTAPKDASGPSYIDSGLPRSAKDVDTQFMAEPHQSPLLESSYATPTGSPSLQAQARPTVQRDESTESVSDFQDALDRPALAEDISRSRFEDISRSVEEEQRPQQVEAPVEDKQDRPSRFSAALSMLPSAGLAGVGALLARGSRDDAAASVDDHPAQGTHEHTAKSIDHPDERSVVPGFEGQAAATSDGRQTPPPAGDGKSGADTPLDTLGDADVLVPNDSPATHMRTEEIPPISNVQLDDDAPRDLREFEQEREPIVIGDTNVTSSPPSTQLPGNESSAGLTQSPKDMETIPETPVDTVEWPEESTSKKKKGKKKKNSVSAASLPVTSESSVIPSDEQQDTLVQEQSTSEAIVEPSSLPHAATSSSDPILQEGANPQIEPDTEPSFEDSHPRGDGADISYSPRQIIEEGQSLTDEPLHMPGPYEASTTLGAGAIPQSQGQGDAPQVGDHSRRSSADGRRLRSSRRSSSARDSAARERSPDIFHSGDEAPPSVRDSTGQQYKKTRSLRSSRRSSLASAHGFDRANEPRSLDAVSSEQPDTGADEHEKLRDSQQSPLGQNVGVEELIRSPPGVVGHVSGPLNITGESTSTPEVHDEPDVVSAAIVDQPAPVQPDSFVEQIQRTGSPIIEEPQRGAEPIDSHSQEYTPAVLERTSPTSSPKAEEQSRGGLASEPLDETPSANGLRSLHDPPITGDEALASPDEPVLQQNAPDDLPTDISGEKPQISEPELAVHDDSQQKLESVVPGTQMGQIEEPFSHAIVEEHRGDTPCSPPRQTQESSELEHSTIQDLSEPVSQEADPIVASAEDDNAFAVSTSKKNKKKKRKSSTIIGEALQSSDKATPEALDSSGDPVESTFEPSASHQDDVGLRDLSSALKETPLELEQQPTIADSPVLPEPSKAMEPEGVESGLIKPTVSLSEDKHLAHSLDIADPNVLTVSDDVPASISISELEKPSLKPQEKPSELPDADEIARREAEADLIRDEVAEMSRLQSKKKLKPKEKTRLRQLKANADRRAEDAAALEKPTSSLEEDVSGSRGLDSPLQKPVSEEPNSPVVEDSILSKEATTGPSTLVTESLQPRPIPESEEAVPVSSDIITPSEQISSQDQEVTGISPTSEEVFPRLDKSTQQRELESEMQPSEDAEDLALREAEAALIRDEEAELSRLENKKKPNKKDKARIRHLRSNSERRAQEAEAAAQLEIVDQDAADLETPNVEDHALSSSQLQEEESTREPASQPMREMQIDELQSSGDVAQTSDPMIGSSRTDPSPLEGDLGAADVGRSSEVQPQAQELSQPHAVTSPGEATAGTEPLSFKESLPGQLDQQAQLESTQEDSAQAPQILVQDTSSQPDQLPNERRTLDTLQSESRLDGQPQVGESISESVETQPAEGVVDMPGTQIERPSEARDDGQISEVQEDGLVTEIHPDQASQIPAEEPTLVSEIPETDRATSISGPFGESEQPAVTVTELPQDPESEWPATTKKSKKDKKKKRKGTLSEGSGQNSGTVTPFFDASEPSPVVESRSLSETVPGDGDVPRPSSFESEIIEQGQQSSIIPTLDDSTVKDLSMGETTANQPLEISVPDQQQTSLDVGESTPAHEISDDIAAKDLLERSTADQPLESTLQEPEQTGPEQATFDEEPEFKIVSKKSKKDKKKKRKSTISDNISLASGSATPIASEEPQQSSSLAETTVNLADEQATTERSSMPLNLATEPAAILTTTEGNSGTKSPVLEGSQHAEEQSLPRTVSGEEPSMSPTFPGIPTGISEPEPASEQLTQAESEDNKRKDSISGSVTRARRPSEPRVIEETGLGSTQQPGSPLAQPIEPGMIASNDFSESHPMATEHREVHSPVQLPETEELRSTSPAGFEIGKPQVESDQASKPARKSDGWGFLAGAITGAGAATALHEGPEKSPEREAAPEQIAAEHSPVQSASRPSLSFADIVETTSASGPKDNEQSRATDISEDQVQGVPFTVRESSQSDEISRKSRIVQEDTSDTTVVPEESQEKEPAEPSSDVVDILPSTRIPLEKDTNLEEVLPSTSFAQDSGNLEGVAADIQGSPQEMATASEPPPQFDDWTQSSSSKKKKKKDKKRKNSSVAWSEAESGPQTPVAETPSEAREGMIDTNVRPASLDAGEPTPARESLTKQLKPETESRASEELNSAPLASNEIGDTMSLEGVPQPATTELAKNTSSSPGLHRTRVERGETSVAAEDQVLDVSDLAAIQNDETISSPVLDPKIDDRGEQIVRATSPEEILVSAGQAQESLNREVQEHESLTPKISSASTEAFATPLQMPSVTQEVGTGAAAIDDQPLDLAVARDSGNDSTRIGTDFSRSLEREPDLSATVQPGIEQSADTPAETAVEQSAEDLWQPISRKLSKKEKRKAKKGSLSTNAPELTTSTPEDNSEQISEDPAIDVLGPSSQQMSPVLGQGGDTLAQDVDKMDVDRSLEPVSESTSPRLREEPPSQIQEIPVEETPALSRKMSKKEKRKAKKASLSAWEDDIAEPEPVEPSQSQTPITVERQAQDIPTISSHTMSPDLREKEATQLSLAGEPQLEQQVLEDIGSSIPEDATAEEEWTAPISRKKSKKDKNKKGKQSSSGSVSGTQTPAVVEAPFVHAVEAVDSGEPAPEHSATPVGPSEDLDGPGDRNDLRSSETITSVPDNDASEDKLSDRAINDTSAPQGRKDHRSAELYLPLEGANDQTLIGSSRDASTPSHHSSHRSAEFYVPEGERGLEVQQPTIIEDDWDVPSDDQSKNKKKAGSSWTENTPTIDMPRIGVHHTDRDLDEAPRKEAEGSQFLRSPDARGKELEKMHPSPDLWDNEDYFRPKPADLAEADQELFTKFDIHPAVARGINTSADRRGEERPLVGLGLIHRHSSIFREDEGHVPKLLTMTSDNVSTDSVAVQETEETQSGESSQLVGLSRSDTVPARPGSSRSYDEGLSPGVPQKNNKQWFTFETGPAHGANVPLARSVSPDSLRPVSPGLPRSPQFPPPRSPQLSPQPSPRSPHFPPPSPRSSKYSPRNSSSFEAARDPSKKGSVAALAQRFGGATKATGKTPLVSDHVDNHTLQEDDLFYEPAMREGAKDNPLQGSRLDVDSGDSWAVPNMNLDEEQSDPDLQNSGQGAAATSHGREPTTPGSDNVSEPCSQPDIDAGKFTPQLPDQDSREAEIPLESVVVESPVLGSQHSVDFPMDEGQPRATSPHASPAAGPGVPEIREATLYDFSDEPRVLSMDGARNLEDIETGSDDAQVTRSSIIDYSRSLPGGLPAVQEEPHEEEAESSGPIFAAKARPVTPDINRDSGVVTGSPVPPRVQQFESPQQQRDSGVHMREATEASPRLLSSRAFSPQPTRLSHSSIEEDGASTEEKSPKRSPVESETQRRFREATPVLEAQDAPVTPEPRKNTSKSRKYPDLGPSPGKKAAAAALAGGGALLAAGATRSRSPSPSPSPSPAGSQRSVSDNTDELRSSALPRQRRAASSNTGISRSRTPEPLNIRAESPSLLRHSGTPPLRSRRTRSGDLRSLSQLSNRSHSDLGAQASSSPASAVSAANKAPAHLPKTTTPASSDLRRATTPAAVAQGTSSAPTANEGRVRSKDMADVYVSRSLN